MYDPYTKIVFDYMGGMEDIRKAKVRMNYMVVKAPKLVIYLKSLHSSSPQNFICRCALWYLQMFLLWTIVVSICLLVQEFNL